MVGSPVARAKRIAGCPDCPTMLCGWIVNDGLLHWPAMFTATALLWSAPQPLVISTQYVFACVSGGVVKLALVAPLTGLDRSSFCPSYHWMKNGVVPPACTDMVRVWPELIVPPTGCCVMCTAVHCGGACGVMVTVLLSTAVVQAL